MFDEAAVISAVFSGSDVPPEIEETAGRAMAKLARREGKRPTTFGRVGIRVADGKLMPRRNAVRKMASDGLTSAEIAEALGVTLKTVETDRRWWRKGR